MPPILASPIRFFVLLTVGRSFAEVLDAFGIYFDRIKEKIQSRYLNVRYFVFLKTLDSTNLPDTTTCSAAVSRKGVICLSRSEQRDRQFKQSKRGLMNRKIKDLFEKASTLPFLQLRNNPTLNCDSCIYNKLKMS